MPGGPSSFSSGTGIPLLASWCGPILPRRPILLHKALCRTGVLPFCVDPTFTGGPRSSSTLSGCWVRTSGTCTTRRRGVEKVAMGDG